MLKQVLQYRLRKVFHHLIDPEEQPSHVVRSFKRKAIWPAVGEVGGVDLEIDRASSVFAAGVAEKVGRSVPERPKDP